MLARTCTVLLCTMALCLTSPLSAQRIDEDAAIREIVSVETYAWSQRDYDTWRACWMQTEYATHHVPLEGMALVGWDTINYFFRENAFNSVSPAMDEVHRGRDYQIRRMGNQAHVIYIQEQINGEEIFETVEMRLLEKQGGQWKIVSVVSAPLFSSDPSFTNAMLNKAALSLMEDDEHERSIELLETQHQLFPEQLMTLERLAQLHFEIGNKAEAKSYCSKILEQDPENDLARKLMEEF